MCVGGCVHACIAFMYRVRSIKVSTQRHKLHRLFPNIVVLSAVRAGVHQQSRAISCGSMLECDGLLQQNAQSHPLALTRMHTLRPSIHRGAVAIDPFSLINFPIT